MTDRSEFAETFVRLRESKGLSCNRVALLADVSQSLLTKVERSERSATQTLMEKLATVFDEAELAELQAARARDILKKEGLTEVTLFHEGGRKEVTVLPGGKSIPPELASKLKPASQIGKSAAAKGGRGKIEPEPLPAFGKPVRLPVFEDVACGWGGVATESPVEWLDWPEWMTAGADHVIRVRGDSMRDVGIEPGTLVFVKRAPLDPKKIPSGKKVIAHLHGRGNGDEYTCKMLVHDRHVSWLQGMADGFMRPIYLHEEPRPRIVGVVTAYHKVEG